MCSNCYLFSTYVVSFYRDSNCGAEKFIAFIFGVLLFDVVVHVLIMGRVADNI